MVPRLSAGMTSLAGVNAIENAGATARGRSAICPDASLYLTMQTVTDFMPHLSRPPPDTGGGGKGSPWYSGSSTTFNESLSGSCRCQYGRVICAFAGTLTREMYSQPFVRLLRFSSSDFHPFGSRRRIFAFADSWKTRSTESFAVTSNVFPGTAMNARSGLSPTGASTVASSPAQPAEHAACSNSPIGCLGRGPSSIQAESSDSQLAGSAWPPLACSESRDPS